MDVTPATAPLAGAAPATLFVALELSRSTWVVALHSPVADKVSQHRLDGGDAEGLMALLARRRRQAEECTGRPVRVVCCFEAGYDGFWLHRWLCARGVENRCWTRPACWWTAGRGGPRPTGWTRPGCYAR
jgi:transposase